MYHIYGERLFLAGPGKVWWGMTPEDHTLSMLSDCFWQLDRPSWPDHRSNPHFNYEPSKHLTAPPFTVVFLLHLSGGRPFCLPHVWPAVKNTVFLACNEIMGRPKPSEHCCSTSLGQHRALNCSWFLASCVMTQHYLIRISRGSWTFARVGHLWKINPPLSTVLALFPSSWVENVSKKRTGKRGEIILNLSDRGSQHPLRA